jgi:30S ribosomal protein S31
LRGTQINADRFKAESGVLQSLTPKSLRVVQSRGFFNYGRNTMGKGDRRTRKGKIYRGSYGKTRPGRIKKKKGGKKQ